jgi:hypothetical protein
VVPAALTTTWTNAAANGPWSNAANWSRRLPDATKVVILDGNPNQGSNTDVTFDTSVQDANRTIAGLQTLNNYSHTLSLVGSKSLGS